jgi:hypothetical protein
MRAFIQMMAGLLFLVIVLFALTYSSWFWAAVRFVQGGLLILLFLIGIGLVLLGASELKD